MPHFAPRIHCSPGNSIKMVAYAMNGGSRWVARICLAHQAHSWSGCCLVGGNRMGGATRRNRGSDRERRRPPQSRRMRPAADALPRDFRSRATKRRVCSTCWTSPGTLTRASARKCTITNASCSSANVSTVALGNPQLLYVKIRHEQKDGDKVVVPFSVFLQFLKPERMEGRQVLYVHDHESGRPDRTTRGTPSHRT